MIYAPRAIGRFGLAAMEGRARRTTPTTRIAPLDPPPPRPARAMRPRTVVRLWLPMTVIFLLLAPFAFLLAPLIYFAPQPYRTRPLAAVLGVGQLLLSLGGTVVDVDTPDALVRIRIF